MDTKGKKTIIQLTVGICSILAIIICATSCKKISGCVTTTGYNQYLIEIPAKLYPAKDTFQIGDTLWIEQHFSDQIHDQRNNMNLNFGDFDFRLKIVISDLIDYKNVTEPLHSKFAEVGTIEVTNTGAVFVHYSYEDGIYKHKMGIVMTKKGLFGLTLGSLRQYDKVDFTRCQTENLDIRYSINEKAENNFYMMKDSKDPYSLNVTKEDFDRYGSYCFYVK